jgi:HSP20 family molecular chaperone IbpA
MTKPVEQLQRSQRGEMDKVKRAHTSDVRNLEQTLQVRRQVLKANNEDAIINIQNENQKQIAAESDKKEKVLTEMRKSIEDTKLRTDKELNSLKTMTENSTKDIRQKHSIDRERMTGENQAFLSELNDNFNEKSRDIRHQGNHRITVMDDSEKQKLSDLKNFHTQKVDTQTLSFNKRYKTDEQKYREFKDIQDKTFEKQRLDTHLRQQKDITKLGKEQDFQLQQKDLKFRQGLKEQDKFLEQKWQNTMKEHTENFKNLDDLHKKVVSKVKTDMTQEVSQLVKRSDDKFYQFMELKPIVAQFPDRVEIKVEVPEHSKQDLQLTTNNKEVILVYNRRFQDTVKNPQGSSKLNRIESFTSRLNVDAILDPRSVKSTYDGGAMTYVIKKV